MNNIWMPAEFVLSIAAEPLDWISTGRDCLAGEGSALAILGAILPGVSGRVGKYVGEGWQMLTGLLRRGDQGIGIGKWVREAVGMSDEARDYQKLITSAEEDFAFQMTRNGTSVNFDGVMGKVDSSGAVGDMVLLDAKDWSAGFTASIKSNPQLYYDKVKQARDQVFVANGIPIQWHFSDNRAAEIWENILREERIKGIEVVWTPKP
jgi:hypothetical protein